MEGSVRRNIPHDFAKKPFFETLLRIFQILPGVIDILKVLVFSTFR